MGQMQISQREVDPIWPLATEELSGNNESEIVIASSIIIRAYS